MLPQIDVPKYSITLPLSKQRVEFRPFLVKEQKILMMAVESNDVQTMEQAMRQILENCTLNKVSLSKLPLVDIEFYFLNLRAKSSGEISQLRYKCENVVNGKECGNVMDINIDLLDVKVEKDESIEDKINITPTVGIKMKYPAYSIINTVQENKSSADITFDAIIECIEYIYDSDQIYKPQDVTREEMVSFLENLNTDQFGKIEYFLSHLPTLKKVIDVDCKKCGFHHKIVVEGLEDFFA